MKRLAQLAPRLAARQCGTAARGRGDRDSDSRVVLLTTIVSQRNRSLQQGCEFGIIAEEDRS